MPRENLREIKIDIFGMSRIGIAWRVFQVQKVRTSRINRDTWHERWYTDEDFTNRLNELK